MSTNVGRNAKELWPHVLVALIVIVVGLGVIVYSLLFMSGIPDGYEATSGTTSNVKAHQNSDGDGVSHYTATVEFSDHDHIEYSFTGRVDSLLISRVDVWYDPRDPAGTAETSADRFETFRSFLGIGAGLVGVGGLAFVLALFARLTVLDLATRRCPECEERDWRTEYSREVVFKTTDGDTIKRRHLNTDVATIKRRHLKCGYTWETPRPTYGA